MDIDLSGLSLEELKKLSKRVDREIEGWHERKRRDALAAAEEAARNHGFNLADLGVAPARGRRAVKATGAARFANPEDSSQTWTGRGRRPAWVNAALASGKSLDDLAI